uniref:Uncharacterized protein n=1 Tax=Rhizophora mucronata TaxID=61149 RepID=A0A2P2JZ81_RHIMU
MLSFLLKHQVQEIMLQQKIHHKPPPMFFPLLLLPRPLHRSFHQNHPLLRSHLLVYFLYLPICTLLVDLPPFLPLVLMPMKPS